MLPKFISGQLPDKASTEVASHVAGCSQCAEAHRDLKDMWWRMGNQTLKTLGFGALGATLIEGSRALVLTTTVAQAGTLAPSGGAALGAAGTSAAGAGVAGTGAATTGSISIFGAAIPIKTAAIAASFLLVAEVAVLGTVSYLNLSEGEASANVGKTASSALGLEEDKASALQPILPPSNLPTAPTSPTPQPGQAKLPGTAAPATGEAGRLSGQDWVPYLDINAGGVPFVRPEVATPVDPGTVIPPTPDEETSPDSLAAPTVTALPKAQQYIAPVLEGRASPGATVNFGITQLEGVRSAPVTYSATADDSGAWTFDLATLELDERNYRLQIWQTEGGQASQAVTTDFQLRGLGVSLLYSVSIDAVDAELDGVPVDFTGPSLGTICLVTDTDQRFDIALDSSGVARRFIRFVGAGDYELRFMNCEGTRYGPAFTTTVEVQSGEGPGFGIYEVEGERRVLVDTQ